MSGAMASDPRYGLAVIASKPRMSYRATAWRAAGEPMSPRLASPMKSTSDGTRPRNRSRPAMPADPNASKKARFGFTAAAYGSAASISTSQNRPMPDRFGAKPSGSASGEGSTPRQRTEPTVLVRAARRSRYVSMAGRLADRRASHHDREPADRLSANWVGTRDAGGVGSECPSSWAP